MKIKRNTYIITPFLIIFSLIGCAQTIEEIELEGPLFGVKKHVISAERNDYILKSDIAYPLVNNVKKKYYTYEMELLNEEHFRSLIIKSKGNSYDITIKMTAQGRAILDKHSTENVGDRLLYIANDTIYAVKKINEPNLIGEFYIKSLTKSQKDNFINYFKSLPKRSVQKAFFKYVDFKNVKKLDSLVKIGAWVIDGDFKIGPNHFRNVIKRAYKYNDTAVVKFVEKHGFKPESSSIYEAFTLKDIPYIKKYFKKLKKDMPSDKYQKLLNTKYYSATKDKDVSVVKVLVELGANVNFTYRNKVSALDHASSRNDCEVVKYLLLKNIKHDAFNPMLGAVNYNNIENIDCLLANGFDINVQNTDKSSLLQESIELDIRNSNNNAFNDAIVFAPFLIDRGIDLTLKDVKGNTALHTLAYAVEFYSTFNGQNTPLGVLVNAKMKW